MKNLSLKLSVLLIVFAFSFSNAQVTELHMKNAVSQELKIKNQDIVDISLHHNITTNDVVEHLLKTSKDEKFIKHVNLHKNELPRHQKEIYSLDYKNKSGNIERTFVILSDDGIKINKDDGGHFKEAHFIMVNNVLKELESFDNQVSR